METEWKIAHRPEVTANCLTNEQTGQQVRRFKIQHSFRRDICPWKLCSRNRWDHVFDIEIAERFAVTGEIYSCVINKGTDGVTAARKLQDGCPPFAYADAYPSRLAERVHLRESDASNNFKLSLSLCSRGQRSRVTSHRDEPVVRMEIGWLWKTTLSKSILWFPGYFESMASTTPGTWFRRRPIAKRSRSSKLALSISFEPLLTQLRVNVKSTTWVSQLIRWYFHQFLAKSSPVVAQISFPTKWFGVKETIFAARC